MVLKLVRINIEFIFLLKCILYIKFNYCGVMLMSYLLINVLIKEIYFFFLI